MFRTRTTRIATRFLLVWFALFVGVASASPWVRADRLEIICTGAGSGTQLVDTGDAADARMGGHGLECALCLPVGAPPPAAAGLARALPQPDTRSFLPAASAHLPRPAAAPLPARGPPSFV
jgi:hypothetical protein